METAIALTDINPNIPLSLWQASSPILQAAIKTAGRVQRIEDVVGMTTEPKISALQQRGGHQATFGIVKMLLVNMNINLHIDNSLTDANIISIAKTLTGEELRWWITLADIDLLCRKIVNGYYGKFYGHFGEGEFNDCLKRYLNERRELHRIQAESHPVADPAVLEDVNLGYHLGADGQLVVHEKKPLQAKKPNRHIFAGDRVLENPAYWATVRRGDEKTQEEIEEINRFNKKLEIARRKMSENDKLKFVNALALAEIEMNQLNVSAK